MLQAEALREGRGTSPLGLLERKGHNPAKEGQGCSAALYLPKFSNSFATGLQQKGLGSLHWFFLLFFPTLREKKKKKSRHPQKGRPLGFSKHAIPWSSRKVHGCRGKCDFFLFHIQTDRAAVQP